MAIVNKPMLLNETGVAANALLTQIAQNIATIATQDTSNATLATLAKSIADEAKTISEEAKEIAKGASQSRVFDIEADMIAWLKDEENANVLKVGDNLYIKDTTVPDYFVSAVLNDANEDGFFYEYSRLATDKVDLGNVVTSNSDEDTTIDNVFGDHEGVSKKISAANLASVVAQQSVMTDMVKAEAIPTGGTYASVQLWEGGPKWAKWNVGATNETEYGDLFAWGATKPYRMNGTSVLDNTGDYSASKAASITTDLKPNEDAATINMGAGWRMPTKAEFTALLANTDVTWTTIGGVNGRKFADKRDASNYIFFPASGRVEGSSLNYRGQYGYYWARSFNSSSYAWMLYFSSSEKSPYSNSRYCGFNVRGVRS